METYPQFYIDSTGLLATSSGGPSLLSYITPFAPDPSTIQPRAMLAGTAFTRDEEYFVWASGQGTYAVKRMLGHLLVFLMPDSAVDEAITTLRDVVEFYSYPAFPAIPSTTRQLKPYRARVQSPTVRPPLDISE